MAQTRFAPRALAAALLTSSLVPVVALVPAAALAQGAPSYAQAPGQADPAFMAPPAGTPDQGGQYAPSGQPGPGQPGPGQPGPGQPGVAGQPGGPGQPPQMTAEQKAQAMQVGADQVVGLYMATCIRYPGDSAGLRAWVTGRGAPPMPRQAADMFLTGRPGQVYDVSYQDTRLALISLDDGGCEAVAEFADPQDVVGYLATALQQSGTVAKVQGDFTDPRRPTVHQRVWQATLGGRQWVLNAVTAAEVPQASLGLHPFVAARR